MRPSHAALATLVAALSAPARAFKYSLGATWASDAYPTGYGVATGTSCDNSGSTAGPMFVSVHSGSGNTASPGTFTNACVTNGAPAYFYRGWWDQDGLDKTGSTSIWLK